MPNIRSKKFYHFILISLNFYILFIIQFYTGVISIKFFYYTIRKL